MEESLKEEPLKNTSKAEEIFRDIELEHISGENVCDIPERILGDISGGNF